MFVKGEESKEMERERERERERAKSGKRRRGTICVSDFSLLPPC